MKKRLIISGFLASLIGFTTVLTAHEAAATVQAEQETKSIDPKDIPKISKAFGHIIGRNIESLGLEFDMSAVIHGIQDALNGIESPMAESECYQAISLIQENAFKKQSEENLKRAEEFLASNKERKEVVELEPGKLQYVRLQDGNGSSVTENDSPLIRYKGKFLSGKVFGESQEAETFTLSETIAGFQKAIVGMKEGEKREVYIHPELGYGTQGYFPPNELLTFEVEVVKANAVKAEEISELQDLELPEDAMQEQIATIDSAAESAIK